MRKYYTESRKKEAYCIKQTERRLNELVTSCISTAWNNTSLKERQKGREDEKEHVSSYSMALSKR
jgi:hypothetical protein